MWLTTVLLRRHVPGRIFSGKHRVAMKVTKHQRKRVNENERRIDSNKELLSYPYLSVADEHSHAAARNNKERAMFFETVKQNRNLGKTTVSNVSSSRTLGLLQHLNVTKS